MPRCERSVSKKSRVHPSERNSSRRSHVSEVTKYVCALFVASSRVGFKTCPQRLKPRLIHSVFGTTEVVPFQNSSRVLDATSLNFNSARHRFNLFLNTVRCSGAHYGQIASRLCKSPNKHPCSQRVRASHKACFRENRRETMSDDYFLCCWPMFRAPDSQQILSASATNCKSSGGIGSCFEHRRPLASKGDFCI